MKHAGAAALDTLEPILAEIRAIGGLTERSRGVFYLKSRAFLHFHEDPKGLFADMRTADGADFDRLQVDTTDGAWTLIETLKTRFGAKPPEPHQA